MDPQSQQPQPVQPTDPTQTPPEPNPSSPPYAPQQAPMPAVPTPFATQTTSSQPVTAPIPPQNPSADQATSSDLKKVKILGYSLLIMGLLPLVLAIGLRVMYGPGVADNLTYVAAVFQALIGYGIIKHSKIAMFAFNIFSALVLVSLVITLGFGWVFISAFVGSVDLNPTSLIILATLAYYVVVCAYIIWGLVVLHPKRVRNLFHW